MSLLGGGGKTDTLECPFWGGGGKAAVHGLVELSDADDELVKEEKELWLAIINPVREQFGLMPFSLNKL